MKKKSTPGIGVSFRIYLTLMLSGFLMMFSKTSTAHEVLRYTVPCFLQGETVRITPTVIETGYNTYFHWQYRPSPGAPWVWLSNTNTVINGHTFNITGASQVSFINNYTVDLVITNVGAAYSTELDNIEIRVLMTDFGLDPELNPGIPVYGGEEFFDKTSKYIRIRTKPATENCYSSCTGNALVVNQAAVPPPINEYYGGFEIGGGNATDNFSTPGVNGTTAKAATDLTQWTGGEPGTNPVYRVMNNADSMKTDYDAFAPHSGMQMMVINENNSCTNRLWYKTVTVSNVNHFFQGSMTFKGWFAKLDGGVNPVVKLEINGGTAVNSPTGSYISLGSVTQSITGTSGNWVQISLTVTLPVNGYKKLEFSIKTPDGCNTAANIAIDDLCLIEPVTGTLPIVLTPLKGFYSNGISHLTWSSLQESNCKYFEIQRSTDGINYSPIGKVIAKGNSDNVVKYSFNDIKANAGINYYRLKLFDNDERFQNSNILALNVSIQGINITGIYPAPFTDKVNITFSSEIKNQATIQLFDNTGKLLITQQNNINKGVTNLSLENLDKLAKGFYIIKIQAGESVIVKKIVK